MFYEESQIKNILKCNKCKQIYDKYDHPRILPCGSTICTNCTFKIENQTRDNKFACNICLEEHPIPEKGFAINKSLLELIETEPNEIYRGRDYEILKSNLKNIKSLVDDISFNYMNGIDRIKEHCSEQRRLIQLATEHKIQEVYNLSDFFLQQIDEYELEHCENFTNEINLTNSTKEIINEANKFINEKRDNLKKFKINDEEIQASNVKAKNLRRKLEDESNRLKHLITINSLIKFITNKDKIDKHIMGSVNFYYHTVSFEPLKLVICLLFSILNLQVKN